MKLLVIQDRVQMAIDDRPPMADPFDICGRSPDFRNIVRWTAERFGEVQARVYAEILTETIDALATGPHVAGVRERNDIAEGLMVLQVARKGRRGGIWY